MPTIQLKHTRVFKSLWETQKRINAFRGGARSSKTWSILQAIAFWLVTGNFGKRRFPNGNFTVCRETLPALRASAYKDFIEILHQMQIYQKVEHRKTMLEFVFQGREVTFISTDDLNSAKLRGRQHTFFYMNEANTISREAFNQLIMRTEQFCILDYNPAGIENWCKTYIEEVRVKEGDCKLDVSTYFDNIDNLPSEMVEEIEGFAKTDPDLYEVYAKGNWVKSRNLVFEKVTPIKHMPVDYEREYFGADFGWNDPTVLVRVLIKGDDLFIEEMFYEEKLSINQMVEKFMLSGAETIYCDHNPLLRKELKRRGVNIRNALKGKDSITKGISLIRSYNINILETGLKTLNDFRKYKYKVDEDGNPTDDILGMFDHAPDAVRYALSRAGARRVGIR